MSPLPPNPPGPSGCRLLAQSEVTAAMTAWAVAVLKSSIPLFEAVERSDFGDDKTYLAWVNVHPPDFNNHQPHRGVTLYEVTDPVTGVKIVAWPPSPDPAPLPTPIPTGVVQPIPVGTLLVDTATKLTGGMAAGLQQAGIRGVIRYLSIGPAAAFHDLDAVEAQAILSLGLGLLAVQHVRLAGWRPSASMGAGDGADCVAHAQAAGLAPGMTIFCDLEGCAPNTTVDDVVGYVSAWHAAVWAKGFETGLYVGAGSVLSSHDLYARLPVTRYWRSASAVPNVDVRGYCLLQTYPTTKIAGVSVDVDVSQLDFENGCAHWMLTPG